MKKLLLMIFILIGIESCKKEEQTVITEPVVTANVDFWLGEYVDIGEMNCESTITISKSADNYYIKGLDYKTCETLILFTAVDSTLSIDTDYINGSTNSHIKGLGTYSNDTIVANILNDGLFPNYVKHTYCKTK